MITPKVFISYAHSSPEHRQTVTELATALRSNQLVVSIDTDVKTPQGPEEGWPKWMKQQIRDADWVLVFFDPQYRRRFDGEEGKNRGLGATWEGAIITNQYYRESTMNKKFIPLLADGSDTDLIPDELFAYTHYFVPSQTTILAAAINPNSDSNISSSTLQAQPRLTTPMRRIEVTLDTDLENFGHEQQQQFLRAVISLLGIADVTIKRVRSGSVKVTIELPTDYAQILEQAVNSGSLSAFRASDAVFVDPPYDIDAHTSSPVAEAETAAKEPTENDWLSQLLSPFSSREKEVRSIADAFKNPAARILCLVGAPGVGKSTLALQMACQAASKFQVHLEQSAKSTEFRRLFQYSFTRRRGEVAPTSTDAFVAEALRFYGDPHLAETDVLPELKGQRLANLISDESSLLVLDGLETFLTGSGREGAYLKDAALRSLLLELANSPAGRCVVTSSEPIADLASFRGRSAVVVDLSETKKAS